MIQIQHQAMNVHHSR